MDAFSALADPTRREVLQLLGERPRRASDLAAETTSSRPAMSRHLKVLLEVGMVTDERIPDDARARVFRLRPGSLVAVQAFLDQLHADWNVQLESFRAHVVREDRAKDDRVEGENHG